MNWNKLNMDEKITWIRREKAENKLTPEEKKIKRLEMIKQRSQNWKTWREGGEEMAGEDEEKEESLEEKIENIELAKTLEQGEKEQTILEKQRIEEEELEIALEKAEKQVRKEEEEEMQEEERIATEFSETGGENHCWNCVHDPCLCSLLKLELRLEMLRSVTNSTKSKQNPVETGKETLERPNCDLNQDLRAYGRPEDPEQTPGPLKLKLNKPNMDPTLQAGS